MLPKSLAGRVAATLALATVIASAPGALAAHGLGSAAPGFLVGLVLATPLIAWLGLLLSRPWTRVLAAVSSGIGSLRDRDFSVSIAPSGGRELEGLAFAALRAQFPPALREASFDVGQLEQVMINLLKNAAESGSPPEAITVSVHPRAQGFVGTGLGLTLCREIVEAHGGRLTLANRAGGGAVVSIHLP